MATLPVYEYRCSKGHEYEKTEGFSAPTEQKCMNCGARARRVISRPAVIFKGSGFYSTDNRGSHGRNTSTPSASSNGHSHDGESKSESHTSTDSKVEAAVD
jgi:putative FmdB family regulatory protein